jgi:hypothetical protein
MPALRILAFRDVSPVGRFEVFKPANTVRNSDFAVANCPV